MESKQYVLTVTNTKGNRENILISKPNADEAYQEAVSLGYSDIDLRTDNLSAADCILKKEDWGVEGDYSNVLSAEDTLEITNASNFQYFIFLTKKYLYFSFFATFVILLLETYSFYEAGQFNIEWEIFFALLLFSVSVAAYEAFLGTFGQYGNLLYHQSWGEWEKCLSYTKKLEGKIPEWDLLFREALYLSALGKLDEALAKVGPLENNSKVTKGMYYGRLIDLYEVAHQYDKVYECSKKSFEADPEESTFKMEYALCLLRMNKDNDLANELVSEMEEKIQGDLIKAYIPQAKGMYLINKGEYQEAIFELEIARKKLTDWVSGGSNAAEHIDFNGAYLAIANARLGNYEKAELFAKKAVKRIKALNNKRLLSKLEDALGRKF